MKWIDTQAIKLYLVLIAVLSLLVAALASGKWCCE